MATFISWNANGISNNNTELLHYIQNCNIKPLAIFIQETHFSIDSSFTIPLYNIVTKSRGKNIKKSGGVAIYIRSDIPYSTIQIDSTYEIIGVQIFAFNNKSPLNLFCIYFPPACKLIYDNLTDIFNYKNSFFFGDFNSKNIIWGSKSTDTKGRIIEMLLNNLNLICINNGKPTRIDPNGTESVLELAICSPSIACKSTFDVIEEYWSDHFPVVINYNINFNSIPIYVPRTINSKRVDWSYFNTKLTKENIPSSLSNISIDNKVDNFNIFIYNMAKNSLPSTYTIPNINTDNTRRSKSYTPYWNKECSDIIKLRKKAQNKFRSTRSFEDKIALQYSISQVKYVLKHSKKTYWENYCKSLNYMSNLGSVWNAIKKINSQYSNNLNNTSTILLKDNSKFITEKEKANILAKEFSFISSNNNLPYNFLDIRSNTILKFLQNLPYLTIKNNDSRHLNTIFSYQELEVALNKSNHKASPGMDNISFDMLFNLPFEFKSYLLSLFNEAWVNNDIPNIWKCSVIFPILKKNKPISDPASYRPISKTSIVSKLLERMVAIRLDWYLNKNYLINKNQSGFCKNRSCLDNATRLYYEVSNSLKSGSCTIAIFLDLQKAFDLVWIEGLLLKLLTFNINGNMAKFINKFLNNRTSYVKIGNSFSDVFSPVNGIPQGCVLSPLLFKLFINDFPTLNNSTSSSLFADDSSIWRSGSSPLDMGIILQKDLIIIENWCKEWGITINSSKTIAILFTKKRNIKYPDLSINNNLIPFVSSYNFLGFIFDEHLTWKEHILNLVSRCLKRINLLRCLTGTNWGANKNILITVYKGLIRSLLDYGSTLFSNAAKYLLEKLDSIQYKSLYICVGAFKGTPLSSLQFECDEPPLNIRRNSAIIKHLVKIACIPNYAVAEIFNNDNNFSLPLNKCLYSPSNIITNFLNKYNLKLHYNCPTLVPPWSSSPIIVDFTLVSQKNIKKIIM